MHIKGKNWKLTILALFCVGLLTSLGFWQLSRAEQKKALLKSFAARTQHTPFMAKDLTSTMDWRFYRVRLEGTFDNAHTLLLDNKIFHGQVGYEVYTPFKVKDLPITLLVDRGFTPAGIDRAHLPIVQQIDGNMTILGMLDLPPRYAALGQMLESKQITKPLRIEFINLPDISQLIGYALFPYILHLEPNSPAAFSIEWQITTLSPEKHLGYAVQWFALALTLLIISTVLNFRSR